MRVVKCIVWDEIVPQHQYAIEALDRTLCDLRDDDKPFGGVTLLIGGDFQQDNPNAEKFAAWLLQIGCGENSDENGKVAIPQEMCSNDIESLMNFIYPDLDSSSLPLPEYFLNHMILALQNTDINSVNETLLDRMSGDIKIYYSADQVIHKLGADDQSHLPITPEFLCTVKSSSLPPGELRIKVGCPLILMRNISPSNGLCNGSHMIVV